MGARPFRRADMDRAVTVFQRPDDAELSRYDSWSISNASAP